MKAPFQAPKSFGSAASSAPAQRKGGLKTIVDNRPSAIAQRKLQEVVGTERAQVTQLMWRGYNPTRATLTGQPRNEYAMTDAEAVRVMDEVALCYNGLTHTGQTIAAAWGAGRATIRDYAHCGGPDSRMHITIIDNRVGGRTYHIPVLSERPGQWVFDSSEDIT